MAKKITKKQRKLEQGMNHVTAQNHKEGYSAPIYRNMAGAGQIPDFVKVREGVPYVNPENFGL